MEQPQPVAAIQEAVVDERLRRRAAFAIGGGLWWPAGDDGHFVVGVNVHHPILQERCEVKAMCKLEYWETGKEGGPR